jgi:hypothetical protein
VIAEQDRDREGVPRGTPTRTEARDARLSVRVPRSLKAATQEMVGKLYLRGLRTSESEMVELLVAEGLQEDVGELEKRLRRWRAVGGIV